MKKKLFNITILSFVIVIIAIGYINSNYFIRSQQWKYKDGKHIGDWVKFNESTLRYRTIYHGNIPIGKVVFCFGKTLLIEDIETKETGYYSNKT